MSSSAASLVQLSKNAYVSLQGKPLEERNNVLECMYQSLVNLRGEVLEANKKDVEAAREKMAAGKLSSSLLSRLDLGAGDKYEQMLNSILEIKKMEDPIGAISLGTRLDAGLDLFRVSSPIGVILIIFEARPEVIANISALCIKSGNAVILKGGKEATHSMRAIGQAIGSAMKKAAVSQNTVQIVHTHADIAELLKMEDYIDLVIPRGSKSLVKYIKDNTRIPVMGHADGICSMYLHSAASKEMAIRLVHDGKLNYTSACNATETLLYDHSLADDILPSVCMNLLKSGCELRCDAFTFSLLGKQTGVKLASDCDFRTEFLNETLSVKIVTCLEEAIEHINSHSSGHTDCIITQDEVAAERFLKQVDSAGVFWNASSRFADGFRYGFGTEVGISTNKLHARGPVGLEGLTSYKYILKGTGQCVKDYHSSDDYKHDQILGPSKW